MYFKTNDLVQKMSRNFYSLQIITLQLLCCFFCELFSYHCSDGLSNAIGHFDMSQSSLARVRYSGVDFNNLRRESRILAIREMRVSQGYGDPLYKKFYDLSIVRFYGALNLSFNMKTRQDIVAETIGSYLFPSRYLPDIICRDINAHAKTVMKASLSRFGIFFNPFTGMTEKDIYGILEFDFSGVSLDTKYTAKLRHAFGEIVWYSGAFLFGQYYHPLFLKESFPRTVDFNMGAPYEPQGLVPQVRLSQRIGPFEFIVALASESYINSYGPILGADAPSLDFIQDAIVPNFNFQARWIIGDSFYGGVIDYKRLVPRLDSLNNYKVNEHIDSIIGEVYAHNVFSWGELNLKAVYSQNGSDQLLISGFAVKTRDLITNFQTYANTAAISAWLDVFCVFFNEELSVGLFAGVAQNLGSSKPLFIDPTTNQPIVFAVNAVAQNIKYSARVSPRLVYARDAFRFGFECTWNGVSYGCLNNHAQVINPIAVNGFSYTVSLDYVF